MQVKNLPLLILVLSVVLTSATLSPHAIYVENNDSYSRTVTLYVDGRESVTQYLPPKEEMFFISYYLKEGEHIFNLSAKDRCGMTRTATYVREVEDKSSVFLTLDLEEEVCPPEGARGGEIKVVVKNKDDDDLWVDVKVDSYTSTKFVASGQREYYTGFNRLAGGEHRVELRWLDPDSYKYYFEDVYSKKSMIVKLGRGESKVVRVEVDRLT